MEMKKNKKSRACSTTEQRHSWQNVAKTIAMGLIACIGFSMNAQIHNEKEYQTSGSIVESIKERLPIETPATGTVVSVEAPAVPLIVTTNMGNVPEQNMRAYAQTPEMFKNAIMGNFRAMGDTLVSLAEAAFNAGIPFAVHITSTTFPEGFIITFNVDDLKKGLSFEPVINN